MDKFEEALTNIDIFCRTLVKKMTEDENEQNNNITIEPMEKLLLEKYVIEETESNLLRKSLISMPQAEDPLVDVFEEDNYVRVLMQCRCKDQKVMVHPEENGLEICKRECHTNEDGVEVCTDKCKKVDLSTKDLQVQNMIQKCSNNTVFEVNIPKNKT